MVLNSLTGNRKAQPSGRSTRDREHLGEGKGHRAEGIKVGESEEVVSSKDSGTKSEEEES